MTKGVTTHGSNSGSRNLDFQTFLCFSCAPVSCRHFHQNRSSLHGPCLDTEAAEAEDLGKRPLDNICMYNQFNHDCYNLKVYSRKSGRECIVFRDRILMF